MPIFKRFPMLTTAVFLSTLGVDVVQFSAHGVLEDLQRTPAGLHGGWWRTGTALFVQDGGIFGAVTNLVFLLVIGTIAEQTLSRPRWLLQYFGVGLASEFVGYAWQPVGGGNSIAVCGLAGAVALALWQEDASLPGYTAQALLFWSGALVGTLWSSGYLLSALVCVAGSVLIRICAENRVAVGRPTALAVAAVGVGLTAAENIHGPALLLGGIFAVLLSVKVHQPGDV
ncbi:rhomboid family intramembrane serine protease [Streptomyces sp. RKAG293]|uniref:rhomboid family intramembrane serine protease n=1 Tax=Streptomyces sp. RKAG293 TaxID=2893403 RepID=UPI002033EAE6|nr:rhomboid family intramembrane serine protease [Streptomyces sp. RKAG293]MCM2420598.1 rhomboid family intramembrane serine protease [Streptomyces sp. RKAG293]